MSYKIAYCAGHYIDTPGKRVPAYLDKNQTREWTLNDRIADYFAEAAAAYEGVELLRTDDPTGKTFIDIPERTAKANAWGADVYIDIHHNAGVNGGSGGGVEAFCYPGSAKGAAFRNTIYNKVITAGGLKGNRSRPLQEKRFDTLCLAAAPAVLIEYGYMDSRTDYPIINTEAYAKSVGYATVEGIAIVAGLKKKTVVQPPITSKYTQKDFIKDIQKALGVSVDGIAGPKTLAATVTVSNSTNRKHAVVKPIQKYLYALGYTKVGAADGVAGANFTAAVKAFQKDYRCIVDGVITAGASTWKNLLGIEETAKAPQKIEGYSQTDFIKDIQTVFGVSVDGIAGPKTLAATVTISTRKNNKHKAVRYIQKRLAQLGYDVGTINGVAGAKFDAAVRAFQKTEGCVADGVITARQLTWKNLLGMC